jgi:nucleoside-diphosphate-sugar epimerase
MRVAITGGSGNVGQALAKYLLRKSIDIKILCRNKDKLDLELQNNPRLMITEIKDISEGIFDKEALEGCDAVVHCAARTHSLKEEKGVDSELMRRTNVLGSVNLIESMRIAKIKRVIFISSIKACGEYSKINSPLKSNAQPKPEDEYGRTKLAAENLFIEKGLCNDLEPIIIRPVLIHGDNPKGNLLRLLNIIENNGYIPIGKTENRRSLLGIDNFCSALHLALQSTKAVGRRYHLSDDGSVSTKSIIEIISQAMNKKPNIILIPNSIASALGFLFLKSQMVRKVFGSLEVDNSDFKLDTGWKPETSITDGLVKMAISYKRIRENRASKLK